ncbi:MAG: hypothetical protein R3321_10835 [Nitrososphaeraceae archaeon]|nr:hypothetical protein [Nitrososphaeraceae archaeon]
MKTADKFRLIVGTILLMSIIALVGSNVKRTSKYTLDDFTQRGFVPTENFMYGLVYAQDGSRGLLNDTYAEIYVYEKETNVATYFPLVSNESQTVCTDKNAVILYYKPDVECLDGFKRI